MSEAVNRQLVGLIGKVASPLVMPEPKVLHGATTAMARRFKFCTDPPDGQPIGYGIRFVVDKVGKANSVRVGHHAAAGIGISALTYWNRYITIVDVVKLDPKRCPDAPTGSKTNLTVSN